jgi:hypothetical protein
MPVLTKTPGGGESPPLQWMSQYQDIRLGWHPHPNTGKGERQLAAEAVWMLPIHTLSADGSRQLHAENDEDLDQITDETTDRVQGWIANVLVNHLVVHQTIEVSTDLWELADDDVPPMVTDNRELYITTATGDFDPASETYSLLLQAHERLRRGEPPVDSDELLTGERLLRDLGSNLERRLPPSLTLPVITDPDGSV